jgi:hypothetical protein
MQIPAVSDVPDISVTSEDLGVMLVCALRYGLGRGNGAQAKTAELIRTYIGDVPDRERLLLKVELRDAIRSARNNDLSNPYITRQFAAMTWEQLAEDIDAL